MMTMCIIKFYGSKNGSESTLPEASQFKMGSQMLYKENEYSVQSTKTYNNQNFKASLNDVVTLI